MVAARKSKSMIALKQQEAWQMTFHTKLFPDLRIWWFKDQQPYFEFTDLILLTSTSFSLVSVPPPPAQSSPGPPSIPPLVWIELNSQKHLVPHRIFLILLKTYTVGHPAGWCGWCGWCARCFSMGKHWKDKLTVASNDTISPLRVVCAIQPRLLTPR